MNTLPFARVHRRVLTLVVAAVLAVAAAYTPVLLDGTASTGLTTTAFACPHSGGGC
jgi:hypothetical protein